MAVNSAFDFVGGYNHGKQAGTLHVANHHLSPGKKQWTWGCGEFGLAWDRQLTDDDGPYFELMTGVFTDNQPDFGWIMPNEERNFRQYFIPYKKIGYVKNATIDAMVNLETKKNIVSVKVYVTAEQKNILIRLSLAGKIISEDIADLSPLIIFEKNIEFAGSFITTDLKIEVLDNTGRLLVSYVPVMKKDKNIPDAAKRISEPEDIATNEELFMAGLHLEQYRHATYSPVAYYEEALRRDPSDIRNNNALGLWYLRRCQPVTAEKYFQNAIEKLVKHNSNPLDGEPCYNLGLSLYYQKKYDEAYTAFFKACWSSAWQHNASLYLARIDSLRRNYASALELVENSGIKNFHGFHSRHLKTILLRKLNRFDEAEKYSRETLAIDPFDFGSGNELYLVLKNSYKIKEAGEWLLQLKARMRNEPHNYIEAAIDYGTIGFYEEAIDLLNRISAIANDPFIFYYLANYHQLNNDHESANHSALQGFSIETGPLFTNRPEDIEVLKVIGSLNARDYKALYYLGNIWYDKRQYREAIDAWENSRIIFEGFPTVYRNLGIAYYNRKRDPAMALAAYEKAFELQDTDSRILFELDQLYKRLNHSPGKRLQFLNGYTDLIRDRDDLYIEYVTLHNLNGKHEEAAKLLSARNFHPWEGGEGKVSGQHILTCVELAKIAIEKEWFIRAVDLLRAAEVLSIQSW